MAVRDVIEITKVEQNAGSEIVFLCFHVRFCTRVDKKKKKKKKKEKKEESERTQSFLFIVRFLVVEKPLNVFSKRNIVKEREKRTQIETYVYVQKEGGTTRDNAKRDIQRGVAQKKRAAGGCSLSPRIVHRLFFFLFFFFCCFLLCISCTS